MKPLEWFLNLPTAWQWVAGLGFLAAIIAVIVLALVADSARQARRDQVERADYNRAPVPAPVGTTDDTRPLLRHLGRWDTTNPGRAVDPWADAEDPWTTPTPDEVQR